MNRCAEMARPDRMTRPTTTAGGWLAMVLAAALLAGCAGQARKPAPAPAKEAAPVQEPAAPAASKAADKGDPDARFTAALKLLKDRQMKEARDAFLELAKDFPQFSGPFTDLAIAQYQSKQPALAVSNFEKATRLNPQNAIAWNWLGTIARENRDYAKAEAAYNEALKVKPDYAAAHFNLGLLYDLYSRRPNDALQHYREYQRLAGGDKLIVTAWIKELESQTTPPAAAAATGATP
jgi:Flp pilus assembly protein TadD